MTAPLAQADELTVPELVGAVYAEAPPAERQRLLDQLMRPLGLLSLAGIAGGVFAGFRLRAGAALPAFDDALPFGPADVVALADHAQQVSIESVDALAQMLSGSPLLSTSAAAALLLAVLVRRAARRGGA
ncbi:MAG: hypothetical protein KGN16_23475 [Burkholderiales bacterium]|nr:hypothetical protein [Burkholderiales bacterium]